MKRNYGGIKIYQAAILLVLAVIGIGVGSFYDLSIAEKFFSSNNLFGKIFNAVGSLPAYALVGDSGILLYFYFKNSGSKNRDCIAYFFLIALPLFSGALWGYDVLTDFASKTFYAIGLGIVIIAFLDAGFYFFAKGCDRAEGYKDAIAILFSAFIVIVLVYVLKKAVVRPRYLFLLDNGLGYYQPWYDFASTLKTTFSGNAFTSLLNSWPSGHAAMAGFGILYVLTAKLNKKTSGKETIFFLTSFLWMVLVAFARMSDGHHFLSDVSWGILIGSGFSVLTAVLIFGTRPELEMAIAKNLKWNKGLKGKHAFKWNEWLINKTQKRETLVIDDREFLAIRRANNIKKISAASVRPSFKLSKKKKSAKPGSNSDFGGLN